ncbi:hypothetical protein ACRALDRAFT_1067313 [Sodiomyces alcalophilus JCM 7366]|uniref:uncharacterized protein n=1 Tax=Sodiomyces alcalophilus JCM 7366 TaxID=591952 RepID=UPI0039B5E0A7
MVLKARSRQAPTRRYWASQQFNFQVHSRNNHLSASSHSNSVHCHIGILTIGYDASSTNVSREANRRLDGNVVSETSLSTLPTDPTDSDVASHSSISHRPSSQTPSGSTESLPILTSIPGVSTSAMASSFMPTMSGDSSLPTSSSSEAPTSVSTQSSATIESSASTASPLTADELGAIISGALIFLLLAVILGIMFWFRRREEKLLDPEQKLSGATPADQSPASSHHSKANPEILGEPAVTGPDWSGWPTESQVRVSRQPHPRRRTLSSELSPFGYLTPPPGMALTTNTVCNMDGRVSRKAAGGRPTQSPENNESDAGQYRPVSGSIGRAVHMTPPPPPSPRPPRRPVARPVSCPSSRPTSHPTSRPTSRRSPPPRPPRPPSLGTPNYS